MRYIFMCRSLTYAQSAARILERNAVTAAIRKAPSGISTGGCSYSVSVSPRKAVQAAAVLRREGLLQGKIFLQRDDGTYTEAFL